MLIVDTAWSGTAADQGAAWMRALGAGGGERDEPVCVGVDRDAEPAVALRARWTLRLFELDENVPHAAVYAVTRRGGRLLPLFAATRGSSLAAPEAAEHVLPRSSVDRRKAETRGTGLRRALTASARHGWRARPALAPSPAPAVGAVKAAFDPLAIAPGPLRPAALALLLAAARRGDAGAKALAQQTLDAMARSGVSDQLDGGFFQAARDPGWGLPDFARTAALNAALLGVYARAAVELDDGTFADVARAVAGYLLGVLRDAATGAFCASQAADERYYTWTSGEVTAALPVDLVQAACMRFNVQPAARLVADPRRNVLYVAAEPTAIAGFLDQPVTTVVAQLAAARVGLLAARAARPAPRLDRSRYVDVNAQVVSALLAGARLLAEPAWQATALQTLAWLERACFAGGVPAVPHLVGEGGAPRDPYLGDYAALGRALLDAEACTGERRYLARAEALATVLLARFRDRRSGALLDEPPDGLVSRAFWPEQPLEDLAGPSPAATAIGLLHDLGRRTRKARYREAAEAALRSGASAAAGDPVAAAGYFEALYDR